MLLYSSADCKELPTTLNLTRQISAIAIVSIQLINIQMGWDLDVNSSEIFYFFSYTILAIIE